MTSSGAPATGAQTATGDDMTLDRAIEIQAQRILWLAARNWPQWEDSPDIGEGDWFAILDRIDRLAPPPDCGDDELRRSYALLTERAGDVA